MRKINTWKFEYRGFYCEISQHSMESINEPFGIWCGYFIVKKEQLPNQFNTLLCRSVKTKYTSMPRRWKDEKLYNIFDFHGGMTYYEVIRNQFNGEKIAVKAGFDCNHYMDDPELFDENRLEAMIKRGVDAFIEKFPDYLTWDRINGGYKKPEVLLEENK